MEILTTSLPDVKLLRPHRHGDARGWFTEVFNQRVFEEAGLPGTFVQDNQSLSQRGVLRGLHYQVGEPQGKLVRVICGHIFDVAVDLRKDSPHFGKWAGFHLRPQKEDGGVEMIWIPEGFAHGFLVLSETAEVLYKTTRAYFPPGERCIRWDDPALAIEWPLGELNGIEPSVSARDSAAKAFADAELP